MSPRQARCEKGKTKINKLIKILVIFRFEGKTQKQTRLRREIRSYSTVGSEKRSEHGADVSIGLVTVTGIVSLFEISNMPLYNLFGFHVFNLHQAVFLLARSWHFKLWSTQNRVTDFNFCTLAFTEYSQTHRNAEEVF